ncbi:MAG: DUF3237 domain-containing protein [Pseudomonadota bacterium]
MSVASLRPRAAWSAIACATLLPCVPLMPGAAEAASPASGGASSVAEPALQFVLAITANIDPVIDMGKTPLGERRVITISGGTFEGPGIKGTIMPGGEDWQLTRTDGVTEFDARYWLKTDDGVIIKVYNRAIAAPAATAGGERYLRTSPQFEAPTGKYDWLNKAIFIGTLTPGKGAVVLRYYKVI